MPRETRTFVVASEQAGLTVLAALRTWIPGTSWSAARKLLSSRRVGVNGVVCLDEARRIKAGETVSLSDRALPPPPAAPDVQIVWLDADVVVVDKPAGMITLRHAAERGWSSRKKRLQPALDEVVPELIAQREKPVGSKRPAVLYSVHRIDRETTGLLVFARNGPAQQKLIGQFKRHTAERMYVAIAGGVVAATTFDSFLVRDRGDGKRGSTTVEGQGQRAITHVRPVERLNGCTLLECRLETGRTHQIRIHLSEAGHPLLGDVKYGPLASDAMAATPSMRLALHAAMLGFDHPATGQRLRFESPLPSDFLTLIERLRRDQR